MFDRIFWQEIRGYGIFRKKPGTALLFLPFNLES